ncbi:hypothetical protein B0H21DRAFT_144703 [Amylocystis lapponica]|nr:hypothetical protein B0H21DRAFT_144703 [Amylocystis lapponica]
MCQKECCGNFHRKCQHFVKLYETGNKKDCGSENCGLSAAHRHTARNCPCPRVYGEDRRILSLIQDRCEACQTAAWAAVEHHSGRIY